MKKLILFILLVLFFDKAFSEECRPYKKAMEIPINYLFLIDRLEYTIEDKDILGYEISSWLGGDYNRIWLEVEGNHNIKNGEGELEKLNILYGRWIAPFWDLRGGIGYFGDYGKPINKTRKTFVIGVKGLAPYMFETDINLRYTDKGEFLTDLEFEYTLWITQRFNIKPRITSLISSKNINELGIGSGVNYINVSLRFLYEIKREFAPYISVNSINYLGNTRDIRKNEGENNNFYELVVGLRIFF